MDPDTRARKQVELAHAEQHLVRGEQAIAQQRRVIADRERHGHPTTRAKELLAVMQQSQVLAKEHVATIERELQND